MILHSRTARVFGCFYKESNILGNGVKGKEDKETVVHD